jgi:hypothetical protein
MNLFAHCFRRSPIRSGPERSCPPTPLGRSVMQWASTSAGDVMRLERVRMHAFIRVAFAAGLFAAASCVSGDAQATCTYNDSRYVWAVCTDKQSAYGHVTNASTAMKSCLAYDGRTTSVIISDVADQPGGPRWVARWTCYGATGNYLTNIGPMGSYPSQWCPTGTEWNNALKECIAPLPSYDRGKSNQCRWPGGSIVGWLPIYIRA